MKVLDSVLSIRATYDIETFTFFRFGFLVCYCLDLERLHVAQDALRPWFELSTSLLNLRH
jgi:hypothetical protein